MAATRKKYARKKITPERKYARQRLQQFVRQWQKIKKIREQESIEGYAPSTQCKVLLAHELLGMWRLLEHIASAFAAYDADKYPTLDQALGITTGGQGRRTEDNLQFRNVEIFSAVERCCTGEFFRRFYARDTYHLPEWLPGREEVETAIANEFAGGVEVEDLCREGMDNTRAYDFIAAILKLSTHPATIGRDQIASIHKTMKREGWIPTP